MKLFWRMRIPVHPVQIHGSYLAWPRWADHYRKSSVELRFLKPLHADDFPDYDTFAATCREKIQFEEYPAPEGAEPISCKKPEIGRGSCREREKSRGGGWKQKTAYEMAT